MYAESANTPDSATIGRTRNSAVRDVDVFVRTLANTTCTPASGARLIERVLRHRGGDMPLSAPFHTAASVGQFRQIIPGDLVVCDGVGEVDFRGISRS